MDRVKLPASYNGVCHPLTAGTRHLPRVAGILSHQEQLMSPASSKPGSGSRDPADDGTDADPGSKKTPSTDMQPEDAGTADSGNSGNVKSGRGSATESASKTGNETGSKR